MIRDLFRILGPQNQGRYREFLVWAVLYGVMQGLAVALLVPAVQALFDQNWGSFVRWLAAMAVCAVISSIAHYLQAMKASSRPSLCCGRCICAWEIISSLCRSAGSAPADSGRYRRLPARAPSR